MDISNMKYNEMQKIAKQVGIKANMKFDRLKTALLEYYQENSPEKTEELVPETKETVADEKVVQSQEKNKPAPKGRKKVKSKKAIKKKNQDENTKNRTQSNQPTPVLNDVSKTVPDSNSKTAAAVSNSKTAAAVKSSKHVTPKGITPIANKKQTPGQKVTIPDMKSKTAAVAKPSKPATPKGTTPLIKNSTPVLKTPGLKSGTPVGRNSTPQTKNVNTPQTAGEKSSQKRKFEKSPETIEQPMKRTRTSFEKSEIPNEPSPRPSSRRSTYSVEKTKKGNKKSTSPNVQDLVSAMDTTQTNEEMKKNLIQALDKKVQNKAQTTKQEKITCSTQIPRFAAFLEKKKQEQNKAITPGNKDWTKIHKKEFDKFDSIDVYLEKKRKHREDTSMSVKKARMLVEQTKEAINRLKNHKTPAKENKVKARTSKSALLMKSPGFTSTKEAFKPSVLSTNKMNLNFSQTRKSPSTFKPTVTSTDKMNLNFTDMHTPSNIVKTPKTDPRKSTGSLQQRKSFMTPFKFNATLNNTIDAGRSAKKFDLKASLSRPMTWKSHKGKLKNVSDTYINSSAKSSNAREERRTSVMNKRAGHKFDAQMAKRGIAQ